MAASHSPPSPLSGPGSLCSTPEKKASPSHVSPMMERSSSTGVVLRNRHHRSQSGERQRRRSMMALCSARACTSLQLRAYTSIRLTPCALILVSGSPFTYTYLY